MVTTKDPVIEIAAGTVMDSKAEAVYRNLKVLYNTVAGEQALDRDFGIDAAIMDKPQETAKALLVAEYVRKTERYEPRARVIRVEWSAGGEKDGTMIPKVVIGIV